MIIANQPPQRNQLAVKRKYFSSESFHPKHNHMASLQDGGLSIVKNVLVIILSTIMSRLSI